MEKRVTVGPHFSIFLSPAQVSAPPGNKLTSQVSRTLTEQGHGPSGMEANMPLGAHRAEAYNLVLKMMVGKDREREIGGVLETEALVRSCLCSILGTQQGSLSNASQPVQLPLHFLPCPAPKS